MQEPKWTLVVAASRNGVIGNRGDLPWKLSTDLRRFKERTMGHCLLMGRKTYESIGRPLPGRQTIVLSRSGFEPTHPDVLVVSDLASVNHLCEKERRVMVVGGGQIYEAALPHCQIIWRTVVQTNVDGDTFFPQVDWTEWTRDSVEAIPAGPKDDWPTEFEQWKRKEN